jgi:DNA mismatch repair ATPase MutS
LNLQKHGKTFLSTFFFTKVNQQSDFPYEKFSQVVQQLAVLDALCSLAECAKRPGYCKPMLSDKGELHVTEGRNPIVELIRSDIYVPNDTKLNQKQRAMIITGTHSKIE